MKLRTLFTAAAFGVAGLNLTPAHAQSVDPYAVYTCMAGISGSGTSGGAACAPATSYFFSLVVFDPHFDAPPPLNCVGST
jgi:hypothetical protein